MAHLTASSSSNKRTWARSADAALAAVTLVGATLGDLRVASAQEAAPSVTNGNDSGPGSYRQAIADAAADPADDVITFSAGLTVTLTSDVTYAGASALTIHGNGSTVDGNGHQILGATAATSVTVDHLTMRDGVALRGGAIHTGAGAVTVSDSTFTGNVAENTTGTGAYGGAISSEDGTVTVTRSTLSANIARATGYGAFGGAVEGAGVTLTESTVTDNVAETGTGGSSLVAFGGAVYAYSGTISVTDSTVSRNRATGDVARGGAVAAHNTYTTVLRSTFDANVVEGTITNIVRAKGGGAVSSLNSSVSLTDTTASNNDVTGGPGGAVAAKYGVTLVRSTLFGNQVLDYYGSGGGAYSDSGVVAATNSTVVGNAASATATTSSYGGGLRADFGDVRLSHTTLASNSSEYSANVSGFGGAGSTSFASVFADPLGGGASCGGTLGASYGYNHSTDATCGLTATGDVQNGADPQLLALGDFGGPTRTRSPKASSPLVDTIPGVACDPTITTDQRGAPRPAGGGCDRGAVEVQDVRPDARIKKGATGTTVGDDVYNTTGTNQTVSGTAARGGSVTYHVTVENDGPYPEQFRLKGTASTTRFRITYREADGTNVSADVRAGTYSTSTIASGATHRITVTVTVLSAAPVGATVTASLKATSTVDSTVKDAVKFVTRRR